MYITLKWIRLVMMCVICIFLLMTFGLVSQVPEEWPTWAREEVGCTDDRHCQSLQTCVEGRCEQFWPASLADNKSKCHDTCKHDVELYENYFYSQTVGKFVHFQFRDQCVVAYFPFGTKTVRLSQSAYDSQSYQSVVHRERVSENWVIALCAVAAASQHQPGLRVAAVAAPKKAKPTVPGWSSEPTNKKLPDNNEETRNKSTISKPNLYVLTTGVRHFQAPQAFTTTTVMGQEQTATVGPTFDEGYGPQQWPEGAKRVVDGHVTVWRKIAAECSDWCFVSEDDAIWPSGLPPPLPSEGFVSFFKEAVCAQATASYSENYDRVVKAVVPAQCMPYGAVAYAITGDFAKMLLSNLPMSKPVDHFLWEQAVVKKKAYVSRRYVVQHKKGKSLRQNAVQHPPPNAANPDTTRPTHIGIAVAIPTHNRARTIISEPVAIPTYKADEHALTPKYVVVMPSVKRNDDIYLKKTLASLEIAKPSEITVILVNGHQPPEHHSCLNDWCASHESYKCIVPPPVPDSLMQKVIRQDKRNDTNHFLRWRTRETEHALFGLKAAASMQTDYIIWIQDDVIVDLHLFDKLKEGDIYCLNDGPDYCGAVGYLFSQKKVQTLIPKIEQNKMSMPIDWIIYDPFDPTLQPLQTIPLVHHIGVKSSKSRPKIAVAIPTYNRAGYVQLCAAALSKTIPSNDVWIFDDHSTEYTVGDLKKWFGGPSVQRNAKRFKADKQARHILEWFVGTDYDWLVTLDSDLIVRPDWLELLRGMLPRTQGVMSLYHSGNPNHPTLNCDPNLCEMKSLGNAGVAWSKVLAKRMLVDMTQSDGFDWGWTEWLRKQKIPQYAAKDSLVLHVGMHGTWGADSKREKSVGFPMDKLSPDVRGRAELFLKD